MAQPSDENLISSADGRWLHRFVVLTACATFPLILVGGLVTTLDVGLADRVWPTAPWYLAWLVSAGQAMDQGIGFLIEHGHRLLGWIVGFLTVVLAIWIWSTERRAWMKWLGGVALAGVVLQGVLGGLRVIMVSRLLAVVHGCLAQVFFAFMVCMCLFTSARWLNALEPISVSGASRLRRLAAMTTGFVFLQLVFGALLRHLGPVWALVSHLIVAFFVTVHVALLAKRIYGQHAAIGELAKGVERLAILTLVQLMLGAGAWGSSGGFGPNATDSVTGAHSIFATAHVAVGAFILASSAILTLDCFRLIVPAIVEKGTGGRASDRPDRQPDSMRREPTYARPQISSLESRDLMRVAGGTV